jgi:hypothetical protein
MDQLKLLEERAARQAGIERGLVMRAEFGADGLVRGTASTYGNADRLGRVILPGAFGKARIKVPFLLNHKDDVPLGESTFIPTPEGLKHESDIVGDPVVPGTGVPIRALLNKGFPATSISWVPKTTYFGWSDFARAEPARAKAAAAAGVVHDEALRYFSELELVENSLVPIPANPRALLEAASLLPEQSAERAQLEAIMEFAAGARHSNSDQGAIQRAHDALTEAGAVCQDTEDTTPLEPGETEPSTTGGQGIGDSGITGGWQQHMRSSYHAAALQVLQKHEVADQEKLADEIAEAIETAAALSSAAINDLPDSDFAYIEPGGTKDSGGRTTPRSLRHFPIHDAAHVRNALARAPQSPFGTKAMPAIRAAAKKFGIDVAVDDQSSSLSLPSTEDLDELERELATLAVSV